MPSMATVSGMSMNSLETDPIGALLIFTILKLIVQTMEHSNLALPWGLKKAA